MTPLRRARELLDALTDRYMRYIEPHAIVRARAPLSLEDPRSLRADLDEVATQANELRRVLVYLLEWAGRQEAARQPAEDDRFRLAQGANEQSSGG